MASVTRNDGKNAMADDANSIVPTDEPQQTPSGARNNVPVPRAPVADPSRRDRGGFFTIYKKGQGYWTRIGTVAGASILALLIAQFLYSRGRTWFTLPNGAPNMRAVLGMVAAFLVVYGLIVFRIINKPTVVDFLIATDSEMKKVNWTTRAELIGSTKVVIFFMLLIAVLLFAFDTIFGYLFYLIKVLQFGPFG
jgi:preprotein translocase subunit SecE